MREINIIAPNIKNGGGLELLSYLAEYFDAEYNGKVIIHVDESVSALAGGLNAIRTIIYRNKASKILLFFKKISNALYFGNLPPIFQSNNSVLYIHNPYLLLSNIEILRK